MTHLLDTNAWLRAVENPSALSALAFQTLANLPAGSLALSAIGVWEIALKVRQRKLTLTLPLHEWLQGALRSSFVLVLPLDAELARLSQELPGSFHEVPAIASSSPPPGAMTLPSSPATGTSSPTPTFAPSGERPSPVPHRST